MKNRNPKVSVILPAFNAERYLRPAVDSILAQTFKDFELIVIDDGSSDATPEILAEYAAGDDRIKCFRQKNRGIIDSLNRGLSLATAPYIARMDADDVSMPDRFRQQVELMMAEADVVLVSGGIEIIDIEGKVVATDYPPLSDDDIRDVFWYGNPLYHPSVMFRKDAVEQIGPYRVQYADDIDLYLRLAKVGKFAALPTVILQYRVSPESLTSRFCTTQKSRAAELIERRWRDSVPPLASPLKIRETLRRCVVRAPQEYGLQVQRRILKDRINIAEQYFHHRYHFFEIMQWTSVALSSVEGFRLAWRARWRLRRLLKFALTTVWHRHSTNFSYPRIFMNTGEPLHPNSN